MKTKIFIIIATVIFLTSCGKETIIEEVMPISVTVVPVTTTVPPVTTAEEYNLYLNWIDDRSRGISKSANILFIIGVGNQVCLGFDRGASINQIVSKMNENLTTYADKSFTGNILLSAIFYLCPEYISHLETHLNANEE